MSCRQLNMNGTSTSTRVVNQLQKQLAAPPSNLSCMQASPIWAPPSSTLRKIEQITSLHARWRLYSSQTGLARQRWVSNTAGSNKEQVEWISKKGGSFEPNEPTLDPPLSLHVHSVIYLQDVTMLWSSTLHVWCDAVLCNSTQSDCRSWPSPLLLSLVFLADSCTSHKHTLEDHCYSYTQQVSKSGGQLLFTTEQLKERLHAW